MDLEQPIKKNLQAPSTDTKMQRLEAAAGNAQRCSDFLTRLIHAAVVGVLFLEWMDLLASYHHFLLDFFFSFGLLCSEGLT